MYFYLWLRDPAIQMKTTETNVSACATEKAC